MMVIESPEEELAQTKKPSVAEIELPEKRFEYSHLAQLKFIVPEAIVLEKILVREELTCCMKPDLRITLDVEAAIKSSKAAMSESLSGNLQLRKVFRSRLLKFFRSHPEGDEVPEEELPQPFGRMNKDLSTNSAQPSSTTPTVQQLGVAFSGFPAISSLMPSSFKRSFSLRSSGHQLEKLKQEQSSVAALPKVNCEQKFAGGSSHEEVSETPRSSGSQTFSSSYEALGSITMSTFPETPVKGSVNSVEDEDQCSDKMASVLKTPVAMASSPMSSTPALQLTKRCYMSPNNNDSCRTPNKLVRRPLPNRPLKFDTPVKNVKNDDEDGRRGNSSLKIRQQT